MYKKNGKDIIYDPLFIGVSNSSTKKHRAMNRTWNMNLFNLNRPEVPKEASTAINSIQSSLGRLGGVYVGKVSENALVESNTILKFENSPRKDLETKTFADKIKEIDQKIMKKAEENKKTLEKNSLISLQTIQRLDELEEKLAKFKKDLTQPLASRTKAAHHGKSAMTLKTKPLVFPKIFPHH